MFRGLHKIQIDEDGKFKLPQQWRARFDSEHWTCFKETTVEHAEQQHIDFYPTTEVDGAVIATIAKGIVSLKIDAAPFQNAVLVGQGNYAELWPRAAFAKAMEAWQASDIPTDLPDL